MLIAEDLLLLITDDDSGRKVHVEYPDILVCAALLADLAVGGYVRTTEKGESTKAGRVVVDPEAGIPEHPVLAKALEFVARKQAWRPSDLVGDLSDQNSLHDKQLVTKLYEGLALAEIVRRDDKSLLGFIKWKNWPAVSSEHELSVRQELEDILLTGTEADVHQASLISIIGAENVIGKVLLKGQVYDRKLLRARVKQLRKQFWPAKAAYDAVQEIAAAAATVVVMST